MTALHLDHSISGHVQMARSGLGFEQELEQDIMRDQLQLACLHQHQAALSSFQA
jgi:hypothetical protein